MKVLSKTVLFAYLLFLLWLVLGKFTFHIFELFDFYIRGLNFIPFAGITQNSSRDILYNVMFFMPFGLLMDVNLQATFRRKLAYIFFFSLAMEIIQYIFAIGITDITDVITNTTGGLLGLSFYGLNQRYVDRKKLDRWVTVTVGVLFVLVCTVIVSFQLAHNRHRTKLPTAPASSQVALDKSIQLAWPTRGEAAVGTVENGVLAISSDSDSQHPTASMAKVITALAVLEKQPLESGQTGPSYTLTAQDVTTYREEAARGGSVVAIRKGMVVTEYQAMQMMLIASANNMADTLADRVFGSTAAYRRYAQDMVQRMGLGQTVIADASGFSPATVSTPSELVTIGIAALNNPVIAEIVAQPQAQIPSVGSITNTNELLGTDGVVGIKTGTTDQAGKCLLFAGRYTDKNGHELTVVAIIMDDMDDATLFSDSRKLLTSAKQALGIAETKSTNNVAAPQSKGLERTPRR